MNDKAIPRNVSMYPEQWSIVDGINNQFGFRNTSIALRYIVEQFQQISGQELLKAQLWQAAKDGGFDSVEDYVASLMNGERELVLS